jgi:formylglycine-generating enzyme required for sulfatase activity
MRLNVQADFVRAASMSEATDPDLILDVTQETLADGRYALSFVAKAREPRLQLYFARFESAPIHGEPTHHFQELFRDLARIPAASSEDWLAGRGTQLLEEVLPIELQRRLWEHRGAIRTIQILSDEAWIPWELLRLQDPDDPCSGAFLVEAFSVTRWLAAARFPVIMELPMRRMALVTPSESGLPRIAAEAEQLKTAGGRAHEFVEIPATFGVVLDALASGMYDGWHFAGHGLARAGGSSLLLDRDEELSPPVLYGRARQLGRLRPLVFLNTCYSGRGAPSFTSVGGLASAFLKAGAGAFIGSHWELGDERARCFAQHFYEHLFTGLPIGEAVREARSKLRSAFPKSSDWLAYTVFAHPLARCLLVPEAPRSTALRRRRAHRKERAVPVDAPAVAAGTRVVPTGAAEHPHLTPVRAAQPVAGTERINHQDGTVLAYVPGGEFTLGADGINAWSAPVHRVRLSHFWVGKMPVTNRQYSRFLEQNPGRRSPAFWESPQFGGPEHPVVGLSWEEAYAYCQWAGLALPSEAQWEAAARGLDQRHFPWGKEPPTARLANFGGVLGGTSPVGAYPAGAGPYGTLDQAGNVWEWCADPWDSTAYRRLEDGRWDPIASGDGAVRVLRGGSWMNSPQDLHAAYRDRGTAKLRFNTQGFRCVLPA